MANCNQNRYLRFLGSFINPKEKNWYHVNIVHSSGKKCPECFFLFTHECTKRICRNEIITGASVQNGKDLYTVSWRFRRGAFSWSGSGKSGFFAVGGDPSQETYSPGIDIDGCVCRGTWEHMFTTGWSHLQQKSTNIFMVVVDLFIAFRAYSFTYKICR